MKHGMMKACSAEFDRMLEKSARSAADLLSSLAARKGFDPKRIPAINQVQRIAGEARPRAAEIASNVRSFLKAAP